MYFYIFKIIAIYLTENTVYNQNSHVVGCDACILVKFTSVSEKYFSSYSVYKLLNSRASQKRPVSHPSGNCRVRKKILKVVIFI
jgi:hypothetical protein